MTTSVRTPDPGPRRAVQFHFSWIALAVLAAGVVLTIVPAARADVALVGFAATWGALYGFMRRSGATIRNWATLMAAGLLWFTLATVSGSLALWAPTSGNTGVTAAAAAKVATGGADLRADARVAEGQFQITNRGQQPWYDVTIAINGSADAASAGSGEYTFQVGRIAAGRTVTLPASRFVDAQGHGFDTAQAAPRTLAIAAHLGEAGPSGTYEVHWQ